ncbi:MAG TPA: alpha/beta hydrolase [Rhizomicrobium sp.]|jgi:pimeloyl-ACP methyl ester carboxylesterase|nr:alpha/beta hydrolase [Rhizomicrobium sp.]
MRNFLISLVVLIAAIVGLFWLFNAPNIPRAVLEAKYATPPSAFVTLPDGARAHYRERGDRNAPALLLLHGSNASLFTWEPWSKRLSDQFLVVSVDLPGHGLTGAVPNGDYSEEGMSKFVEEFADKIGLTRFSLAGNSMGGAVAARFAEQHPDRVASLILIDAGGLPFKSTSGEPIAFRLARIPVLNQLLLHVTPRAIVTEGLNKAVVHKWVITDAMIDTYWDFARMDGTRAATLSRFSLPRDNYVAKHVKSLTMPTLILWGAQDRLIPVSVAHDWARAVPGSKLIIYPSTGHIPMEEVAKQSSEDARAFLSSR